MKHIPTIFLILIILTIWSCEDMGEPMLEGCLNQSACNHDLDATVDDGSCTYAQENYNCSGECIASDPSDCCDAGEVPDCNGTCGGSAVQDCAGTCNGSAIISGCDNVCGSTLENDTCNVCGGDGSTCNISYSTVVEPIFTSKCTPCHISGTSGGLNLSTYQNLSNSNVIVPSQSASSLLITKLESGAMPATGCCLEPSLIQLIATWINEGAQNN